MGRLVFLGLSSLLFLAGCSKTINGFPETPKTSTASFPDPEYLLGKNALIRYNEEANISAKKILRNEIIDARIDELNKKFDEFQKGLYQEGIGSGVGTDWAVLALTAATTVTGGETTKAALGAVSTAVVGGKAAFDKEALFNKSLLVLIAQMVAQRGNVIATIRENQKLSVESYSIYAALSDLSKLEFAGSIPGSLQTIAQDAGAKVKEAEKKIQDIHKDTYLKDQAGDLLRAYWKPDGKSIYKVNETKLKNWMTNNNLSTAPGAITMFLRSETLENARLKAVKDLGLIK